MADRDRNTQWHRLFGRLLQELLTPVGLTVQTELDVSNDPPEIDIVIIRRETKYWTEEQLERLPDGVRHSSAPYILLEFKYTESFNEDAIYQIISYEHPYRKAQKLSKKQVQSFLVISKTPRASRLADYEYEPTAYSGVYKSNNILISRFPMLVLNELGNEAYNVYFKLFASKLAAKQQAVKVLEKEKEKRSFSQSFVWLVQNLITYWFIIKGDDKMFDLTPEQMAEERKIFERFTLPYLSLEERLALVDTSLEEWSTIVPLEERLASIPLEERLASIPLEERLASIPLEELSETNLKKIPFIHHIEEKGVEKGEHKAIIESLTRIISLRFKTQSEPFESQLAALSLKTLKDLTDVALTVDTLAEFEQALAKIQAQTQDEAIETKKNNTDTI